MVVGWVCLAVAAITLLLGIGAGPETYEISYARAMADNPYASETLMRRAADGYARQWSYFMAAGGSFSLFLVFWGVGYIARAISFLPGTDPAGR